MKTIAVRSRQRAEMIDVTDEIAAVIREEGFSEGFCFLFVPHTTAAVTINEGADPAVRRDILKYLAGAVPRNDGYEHAEGNSDAHILSSMMGASEAIAVEDGKMILGTWQSVFFCEFDGPRSRRLLIQLSPSGV